MKIKDLFSTDDFSHKELFPDNAYPWEPLKKLKEYMDGQSYPAYPQLAIDGSPLKEAVVIYKKEVIRATGLQIIYGDTTKGKLEVKKDGIPLPGASVIMAGVSIIGTRIALGEGVLIETGAMVKSPAIIGDNCEIRQGAYLRGYCLAGKRCVLGHATEVKHSIFLNDAKAGHFAYLGDSILGAEANLGAGTKFANLRFLPGNVTLSLDEGKVDTGLRKFGAILGDYCQTGCNSVTNPGTIMGKKAVLMPNTTAKAGIHKAKAILR